MYRVRAVDNAVDHRICHGALPELLVPARWRELRAQDERPRAASPFDYLQYLARLVGLDVYDKPQMNKGGCGQKVGPIWSG